MIIEGTLALTGQYFITDYMREAADLLRASSRASGTSRRTSTATSPTAPGTSSRRRRDPALRRRIQAKLFELIPIAAGVLVPPGARTPRTTRSSATRSEETNEFAFTALTRRLKVIGVFLTPEGAVS